MSGAESQEIAWKLLVLSLFTNFHHDHLGESQCQRPRKSGQRGWAATWACNTCNDNAVRGFLPQIKLKYCPSFLEKRRRFRKERPCFQRRSRNAWKLNCEIIDPNLYCPWFSHPRSCCTRCHRYDRSWIEVEGFLPIPGYSRSCPKKL